MKIMSQAIEDVTHVICNCPEVSARYYLPVRHDRMGKILYTSHIQKLVASVTYKTIFKRT